MTIERDVYRGRAPEFVTMLLSTGLGLLGLAVPFPWLMRVTYPAESLSMVLTYLWSRHYPDLTVTFYGIIPVQSFYVPFAMAALSALFSGTLPWGDVAAIGVAHGFYYMDHLLPTARGLDSLVSVWWGVPWLCRQLGLDDSASSASSGSFGTSSYRRGMSSRGQTRTANGAPARPASTTTPPSGFTAFAGKGRRLNE